MPNMPSIVAAYLPILVAIACWIGGIVMLLKSMHRQDLFAVAQTDAIASLCEHVGECVKTQAAMQVKFQTLQEQCISLQSKQHRTDTRAPENNRINTAMRLLKRGTRDTATLQELGLSSNEAKLLIRLHGETDNFSEPASPSTPPLASQGQALAQMLHG